MGFERITKLFNDGAERKGAARGLLKAIVGRGRIGVAMGCYSLWMIACCMGRPVEVAGFSGLLVPGWILPLVCNALASTVIALRFRQTRAVRSGRAWTVTLMALMTAAAILHLAWMELVGLPVGLQGALYVGASVLTGAGAALFRVEIDRVFGWLGTQQTLYQGVLAVGVQGVMLVVCLASGTAGESRGACETLGILALALPAVTGWLLYSVVRVLPRRRFFEHGLDAPLPFPTKFVATSAVQGVAAGALYGAMFLVLGKASNLSWEGAAAEIAGAVLLFLTALFLRLDFNRFIYKVAFPFVAAGFLLVGGRWVGIEAGAAILMAGFCYLDLVLWSLGACLIKNMGLPATWVAACPGAALFLGAVVGGMAVCAGMAHQSSAEIAEGGALMASLFLASALFLSSGSNMKYGWGTIVPGEGSIDLGGLEGVVRFMAVERGVSQRETEVMELLVQGKTRREICEALIVSPDTVKTHVRAIYRKLDVHSQQDLIDRVVAERDRLVEEPAVAPLG